MNQTQAVTTTTAPNAQLLEQVLIGGDLSKLSAADRVRYYNAVCESLNLNPLTKPFEYITLNGKMVLYAGRNCTDQLRANHHIALTITGREKMEDVYIVTARATTPDGRHDESIGAVPLASLKGEALANAMMKAETKAKRRVTLSICGLSWADETEVPSIPNATPVTVDIATGEIAEEARPLPTVRSSLSAANGAIIKALVAELGWPPEHAAAQVQERYSKPLSELSGEQVQDLLDWLRRLAKQASNDAEQVELRR